MTSPENRSGHVNAGRLVFQDQRFQDRCFRDVCFRWALKSALAWALVIGCSAKPTGMPARYNSASELSAQVNPGTNSFDFALEKK